MPARYISEQEYRRDVHRVSQYLTLPVRAARTLILFLIYGTLLPFGVFLVLAYLYSLIDPGFQKGQ